MIKRLYRNKQDSIIAGICSGIGDYLGIDPVIFRIFFLCTFFFGGFLVYIIAWFIIPLKEKHTDKD